MSENSSKFPDSNPGADSGRPLSANTSRSRLVRNVIASYLGTGLTAIVGFFATPLLLRYLGSTTFGLWTLLLSVTLYLAFIEVGLYNVVAKRVAEYLANDDQTRLRELLGTAFALYFTLIWILLAMTVILAANLGRLFAIPPEVLPMARLTLLFLGANQGLGFLLLSRMAILYGAGRQDLMIRLTTLSNLAGAIFNVILVMMGFGPPALAGCLTVIGIGNIFFARRIIACHLPTIRVRLHDASFGLARDLLSSGSRNMLISISGQMSFNSDALIIGLLMPIGSITHYTLASKLVNLVTTVAIRPAATLLPTYAHLYARRETERLFRLYTDCVTISMILCLPFTLAFCLWGERILTAWVGPGHALSYPVLAVLSFWLLVELPGYASIMILMATEQTVLLTRISVGAAIGNLMLSFLLTGRLGILGPAVSSLSMAIVMDFIVLPLVVCRTFGFAYPAYWQRAVLPLLAPLLLGGATAFLMRWVPVLPLRVLPLGMLCLLIGVCWLFWLCLGLEAARRRAYLGSVRNILNRQRSTAH